MLDQNLARLLISNLSKIESEFSKLLNRFVNECKKLFLFPKLNTEERA